MFVAAPAAATPPQVVNVQDQLFARTADTLFILRTVTDNHGLHSVLQTDTLVVFRSLSGGDDRGFQIAARVIDYGPDYGQDGDERVASLPLPAPINPYEIFADFGAWPITDWRTGLPDDLRFDQNGLWFSGYDSTRATGRSGFGLSIADIAFRIEDTLQATRGVAPRRRVGGGTTGPDAFDPGLYSPLDDCTITSVRPLYDIANDPALTRLTCEGPDGLQQADLWLVVPRIPQ